uniref:Achaete-scute complex protein T5 n=1 Tax=Cacopsylla melanoneura TaxID=428564 RepID=A0A8D8ZD75_9HEMI
MEAKKHLPVVSTAAKCPTTVRRNARERRRVQAVNEAFCKLRRLVPQVRIKDRSKRLSKLKTLASAMEYIAILSDILSAHHESWSYQFKEDILSYEIMYQYSM